MTWLLAWVLGTGWLDEAARGREARLPPRPILTPGERAAGEREKHDRHMARERARLARLTEAR